METLIKKFEDLKAGDVVLAPFPMTMKDMVGTVTAIIPTHKYPFSEGNTGKKGRIVADKSGNRKTIYAEDEGCDGTEMMMCTDIWLEGGSLHIKEIDDVESFNIRIITEEHPKYNKEMAESGKMMGDFFGAMMEAEENGEENLGASMMNALGGMFGKMGGIDPKKDK